LDFSRRILHGKIQETDFGDHHQAVVQCAAEKGSENQPQCPVPVRERQEIQKMLRRGEYRLLGKARQEISQKTERGGESTRLIGQPRRHGSPTTMTNSFPGP
jgi:hypothetical protein